MSSAVPSPGPAPPIGDELRDPRVLLAALGGPEVALLTGVTLAAAERRVPVMLDGLVTSVAALLAVRLEPAAQSALVAGQRSRELVHAAVLGNSASSRCCSCDCGRARGSAPAWPPSCCSPRCGPGRRPPASAGRRPQDPRAEPSAASHGSDTGPEGAGAGATLAVQRSSTLPSRQ